jgi:hypothetical protein
MDEATAPMSCGLSTTSWSRFPGAALQSPRRSADVSAAMTAGGDRLIQRASSQTTRWGASDAVLAGSLTSGRPAVRWAWQS